MELFKNESKNLEYNLTSVVVAVVSVLIVVILVFYFIGGGGELNQKTSTQKENFTKEEKLEILNSLKVENNMTAEEKEKILNEVGNLSKDISGGTDDEEKLKILESLKK